MFGTRCNRVTRATSSQVKKVQSSIGAPDKANGELKNQAEDNDANLHTRSSHQTTLDEIINYSERGQQVM